MGELVGWLVGCCEDLLRSSCAIEALIPGFQVRRPRPILYFLALGPWTNPRFLEPGQLIPILGPWYILYSFGLQNSFSPTC